MAFFAGKTAVVTGGASGLGAALSRGLCRSGARVVIADIDMDKAEAFTHRLTSEGFTARAVLLDVTDSHQFHEVVDSVVEAHGRIDLIINNAGIGVGGEFQDVDEALWRKIVDINLMGVVYGTQAAYKHMTRQRSGRIVNIASMWGLYSGVIQTAYSATKHGVMGMTQGLRAEAKAFGVDVQAVCPGYIETPLFESALTAEGLEYNTLRERITFKFMDVETAAEKILKGIEKNKAIIVFPFYTRLLWWIYRISPAMNIALSRFTMRLLRKYVLNPE